jgi:iron(III) transport system substrate-binding protein
MRSIFGAGLIAAALAFGLPSQAQDVAAAKREGKVVLYSDQTNETIQALQSAFTAKYGIEVDFYRADSTAVAQRFETESAANRNSADVVTNIDRLTAAMARKGLFQSYVSPEAAAYPKDLQQADGNWANFALSTISFAWNSQKVSAAEAPKDWKDLLDPKWRGKIAIQDPLTGSGSKMWIITMYRELGEQAWFDYMRALVAQKPVYAAYLPVREMMASGEVSIQVAAYPDFTEPLKVKGAPVEWGTPGFIAYVTTTVSVAKNAPQPNAAKLFVDFLLSSDGQKVLGDNNLIPARPENRPGGYQRLNTTKMVRTATELLAEKEPWFNARIQELFGNR